MDYLTVRTVHIATACISIALFTARGAMQLGGIDWRRWRWLRIAPHLNDTVLLTAAITLAVMSGQYPLAQGWLTANPSLSTSDPFPGFVGRKPAWMLGVASKVKCSAIILCNR